MPHYVFKQFNFIFLILFLIIFSACHAEDKKNDTKEPARRALPAPFPSPPFPSGEYDGSPLIGVPPSDSVYPLMKAVNKSRLGEFFKKTRIKAYGWINFSGNFSTCEDSNLPAGYWIVPNRVELDQFVFRLEREVNSVQRDHIDFGFRSTFVYGIDYRPITAGGWTDYQLYVHNYLYGYDFSEQYIDVYFPKVAQGMIIRIGRYTSPADIESFFVTDNYMGSHSLLFIYDTVTQTGILFMIMINKNWTIQAGIHAGTDMAPWYEGAVPTGFFAVRWVSTDNNDSVYLVLNDINSSKFRRFTLRGKSFGHDNYNCFAGTWQHRFSEAIHTKFEGYIMWQRDAVVGGTPSIGPVRSFGGGGGIGRNIPGTTWTYGLLNFTVFELSKKSFLTLRNEVWRDVDGARTGFPGTYSTHAIGITYNFSEIIQVRPEFGYYRNWNHKAFDLGKTRWMVLGGVDVTIRY